MQGNLVMAYFMQRWGAEWTREHIQAMVAVSGPWGGAVDALKGPIS